MDDPRARARSLAAEAISEGDPTAWFERLYAEARTGTTTVPWADYVPNGHLIEWWRREPRAFGSALVVGCGFGDDAEWLTEAGVDRVVAFDISPTAIEVAQHRFPMSRVQYVVADAARPHRAWHAAFDFVFEAYTLQVLPSAARPPVATGIATTVAPAATLLVVARGRSEDEPEGSMPWPLLRAELVQLFAPTGLRLAALENFHDNEEPPVRRLRAELVRPQA